MALSICTFWFSSFPQWTPYMFHLFQSCKHWNVVAVKIHLNRVISRNTLWGPRPKSEVTGAQRRTLDLLQHNSPNGCNIIKPSLLFLRNKVWKPELWDATFLTFQTAVAEDRGAGVLSSEWDYIVHYIIRKKFVWICIHISSFMKKKV